MADAGPEATPDLEGGRFDVSTGGVMVGGSVDNCPMIVALGAAPNELDLGAGGVAMLTVQAIAPFNGMATFLWSAPSGTFGAPTAAMTTFACTQAGIIPVTVTASYQGCDDHMSVNVTCLAVDGGG
jgi:hypothetical protein